MYCKIYVHNASIYGFEKLHTFPKYNKGDTYCDCINLTYMEVELYIRTLLSNFRRISRRNIITIKFEYKIFLKWTPMSVWWSYICSICFFSHQNQVKTKDLLTNINWTIYIMTTLFMFTLIRLLVLIVSIPSDLSSIDEFPSIRTQFTSISVLRIESFRTTITFWRSQLDHNFVNSNQW